MKILMVNKFHYLKGGSETYYFSLKSVLQEHGHEVLEFSMKDSLNLPSPYSEYFVENIDYNESKSILEKVRLAAKLIYSFEARNKIEKLILRYKPDIAHLNIFQHQLSPSILGVFKKYNIPVVYTAHDFKMICPNYKMLLDSGEICQQCRGERYYKCIKNRCVKGSLAGSAVETAEAYFHKLLKSYDIVDMIITPSNFYREIFMDFGIDSSRIVHLPNFIDEDKIGYHQGYESYYSYFGRLSSEKGVKTLIEAAAYVDAELKIIGTGPLEQKLKDNVKDMGMDKKINFLGYKSKTELSDIIGNSRFVVVPSVWYENAPYSILEAMAMGKPVIASNIGGIPELVRDKETGLVFEPLNVMELSDKISQLFSDKGVIDTYGINSRAYIEKIYNKETYYKKIIGIYEDLIYRRLNGHIA